MFNFSAYDFAVGIPWSYWSSWQSMGRVSPDKCLEGERHENTLAWKSLLDWVGRAVAFYETTHQPYQG